MAEDGLFHKLLVLSDAKCDTVLSHCIYCLHSGREVLTVSYGAGEMALWVKAFAAKLQDLSLISGTHTERQN